MWWESTRWLRLSGKKMRGAAPGPYEVGPPVHQFHHTTVHTTAVYYVYHSPPTSPPPVHHRGKAPLTLYCTNVRNTAHSTTPSQPVAFPCNSHTHPPLIVRDPRPTSLPGGGACIYLEANRFLPDLSGRNPRPQALWWALGGCRWVLVGVGLWCWMS